MGYKLDDLIVWGDPGDGMGTRLFAIVMGCVIVLGFAWMFATEDDRADPLPCKVEDEVLVEIKQDAYDMDAGDVVCIHIDAFPNSVASNS